MKSRMLVLSAAVVLAAPACSQKSSPSQSKDADDAAPKKGASAKASASASGRTPVAPGAAASAPSATPSYHPRAADAMRSLAIADIASLLGPAGSAAQLDLAELGKFGFAGEPDDGVTKGLVQAAPTWGFTLESTSYAAGAAIEVKFDTPLNPPEGQRHWITIIPVGTPDSQPGSYAFVTSGATSQTLRAPQAGKYEVRLHDFYPQFAYRVIARQTVDIFACENDATCSAGTSCQAGVCTGSNEQMLPPPEPEAPPEPEPEPPPPAPNTDQYGYLADGWPAYIPPPGSPPPSVEDWRQVPRETRVTGSSNLKCETKMLDEWLRVNCHRNDFGAPIEVVHQASYGQQAYRFVAPNQVTSIVVQMIPGKPYSATFTWRHPETGDVSFDLTATWSHGRPVAWFNVPSD
ncbi:MAG: hypothetical protein U0271_40965 [Polyangiaceae bacterium]